MCRNAHAPLASIIWSLRWSISEWCDCLMWPFLCPSAPLMDLLHSTSWSNRSGRSPFDLSAVLQLSSILFPIVPNPQLVSLFRFSFILVTIVVHPEFLSVLSFSSIFVALIPSGQILSHLPLRTIADFQQSRTYVIPPRSNRSSWKIRLSSLSPVPISPT
jgi:hypothetical protein